MSNFEDHGTTATGRPLKSATLARLDDVSTCSWPSTPSILLLAIDGSQFDGASFSRFAQCCLSQGVYCVCVWGPDCERVHDVFDDVIVQMGLCHDSNCVLTTWHANESLEDALWFALTTENAVHAEAGHTPTVIAVSINNNEWAQRLARQLNRADEFVRELSEQNNTTIEELNIQMDELRNLTQTRSKGKRRPNVAPLPRDPQSGHSEGER